VHEIAHEMLHRGDRRTLTTSKSARLRPKPCPLWSANLSDLRTELRPKTTYSFGTETAISCARAWKPSSKTAAVILGGIAPEPAAVAAAA